MTASSAAAAPGIPAVTRRVRIAPDLISTIPDSTGTLSFVCGGNGLVAWGEHARLEVTGADAADQIGDWFRAVTAELAVDDRVGVPGSGPVAFVSLGFEDQDTSVAIVPAVLLGRRDDVTFSTVIGGGELRSPAPVASPGAVSYADADLSAAGFQSAVAAAVRRIRAGELAKVVLAHDLQAFTERPVDERYLLQRLAATYPTCWTFAVDGLVGASPETLIRRTGRRVASRVLAGTRWPVHAGDAVSADLLSSVKDLNEHRYAVASVARVLSAVADDLLVPEMPHPLVLANLTHLATDVVGTLDPGAAQVTALQLAARLHPTAAVGGFPTAVARQVIRELEPSPRHRYAAPVGWLDSTGDGEFAIALRCAQVDGRSIRLTAGCGVMADSDPEVEAREAQIKMVPIRDALESD